MHVLILKRLYVLLTKLYRISWNWVPLIFPKFFEPAWNDHFATQNYGINRPKFYDTSLCFWCNLTWTVSCKDTATVKLSFLFVSIGTPRWEVILRSDCTPLSAVAESDLVGITTVSHVTVVCARNSSHAVVTTGRAPLTSGCTVISVDRPVLVHWSEIEA
jgi:hypothetical protein